jgi:hypothetical protein
MQITNSCTLFLVFTLLISFKFFLFAYTFRHSVVMDESLANYSQVMGPLMDKFEGTNYMLWGFKMEIMLKVKELWGLIDKIEVKPNEVEIIAIATFVKKENQAPSLFDALLSPLLNSLEGSTM